VTWKDLIPENSQASTQIDLNRNDAEIMVTALLTAISEFDRQVEAEKSTT
jgi:hypothetical protein